MLCVFNMENTEKVAPDELESETAVLGFFIGFIVRNGRTITICSSDVIQFQFSYAFIILSWVLSKYIHESKKKKKENGLWT